MRQTLYIYFHQIVEFIYDSLIKLSLSTLYFLYFVYIEGYWKTYLLRSLDEPRHFGHPVDRTAAPLVSPSERVPRKSGAFSTNRRGECDYRIRAVRILHFVTQTRPKRLRRIQKTHPSDRRVRELADSYATHRKRDAWDSNANELTERKREKERERERDAALGVPPNRRLGFIQTRVIFEREI